MWIVIEKYTVFPGAVMKKNNVISIFTGLLFLIILAMTPVTSSFASTQPYITAHGINFATGNKYRQETDYRLDTPGLPIVFTRTYNSQSTDTSALGYGWTTTGTERLLVNTDTITLVQPGGRHVDFVSDGNGKWINESNRQRVITSVAAGYRLQEPSGAHRLFDTGGRITEKQDRNGNFITYSYANDQLVGITDNFGNTLAFAYDNNRLTTLTTPAGLISYTYAGDNLASVTMVDNTTRQYLYDDPNDPHNLTGIIDANGVRIRTIVYDAQDRVTSSAFADGARQVSIDYQPNLRRVITNSLGIATTYDLEVHHGIALVKTFTGPGCSSCGDDSSGSYTYNDRLQVLSRTDGRGIITTYEYDARGNRTKKTEAAGSQQERATTWTYEPDSARIATITKKSVVDPTLNTTISYTYDANGNILTKTRTGRISGGGTESATITYTYDAMGRITSIDGPRTDVADTTTFTYYPGDAAETAARNRLQKITDAAGDETRFENYNPASGKPGTIYAPDGTTTYITYDPMGRILTSSVEGLTTTYTYFPDGKIHTITTPGSRTVTYAWTPAGDLDKITDNQGNSIAYEYDSEGRKIREEIRDSANTLTAFTRYAYTDGGKVEKVINPDDSFTGYSYDQSGNLISLVDALNKSTTYDYDALDRLTGMIRPGNTTTTYAYDLHDNRTAVTDAENHQSSFLFNDLGRRLQRNSPDTGTTDYVHDMAGNVTLTTNSDNITVSYHYDGLNRLTAVDFPGAAGAETFNYQAGKIAEMHDPSGSALLSYQSGRLTAIHKSMDSLNTDTTFLYDIPGAGDLIGIDYPTSTQVRYSHDSQGRISGITIDGAPFLQSITYLPFGPVKSATGQGSFTLSRTFDQRYQVSRIQATGLDYQLSRDAAGRVTSISGITPPNPVSQATDYSYQSGSSRLTATTGSPARTYTTSNAGNITSDSVYTYTYDALNRLVRVNQGATVVAEYSYDGFDRRVKKIVSGQVTYYLYDPSGNLLSEIDGQGNPLRDYFYLNNIPVGMKVYGAHAGLYYIITDHLGTPRQIVDSAGTVVWHAAYLPFGRAQILTGTITCNLRFPGQYFDEETGLHYNFHRYYNPDTGRYLTADPIGLAGGINLYAYVQNDPVNFVDPWGLTASCPLLESQIRHTGWRDYAPAGDWRHRVGEIIFHCGFKCYIEQRDDLDEECTKENPLGECCYDNGILVQNGGCQGSPDQYDARRYPRKHTVNDTGGIFSNAGAAGFSASILYWLGIPPASPSEASTPLPVSP